MAATSALKNVHWSSSPAPDTANSFSSEDSTSFSSTSTSSLAYVNAQLVSHGFVSAPTGGISLEGLDKGNMDRVVKCLLDFLSQRVKDMNLAEQLTTQLRTSKYDHERMVSMYHSASESAANFEREVNVYKTRLASMTKSLEKTQATVKSTTLELSRTQGALVAVRATHQMELKKKEKQVEKMVEKWNKISDQQAKMGAISSGVRFSGSINANATVLGPGKGKNYMEIALEEAEKTREMLGKENYGLRKMVLKAVNVVQSVIFGVRRTLKAHGDHTDASVPTPLTLQELFPLSPPDFTTRALSETLDRLQEVIEEISGTTSSSQPSITPPPLPDAAIPSQDTESGQPEVEIGRLKKIIDELKLEIRDYREQAASQAIETTFPDAYASLDEEVITTSPSTDASNSHSETDTSADLAGTSPSKSKRKSKFTKSPSKRFHISVGSGTRKVKTIRVGNARRRSSSSEPSFETEVIVIPSIQSPISVDVPKPIVSGVSTGSSSTTSLLPTTFVLPPPSPYASLPPPKPEMLLSGGSIALSGIPVGPLFPSSSSSSALSSALSAPTESTTPPFPPQDPDSNLVSETSFQGVGITVHRPFPYSYPVAKPLARQMIHAYSPVRPSPLSRILMLGNSPGSDLSPSRALDALMKIDELEGDDLLDSEIYPPIPVHQAVDDQREDGLMLAQELGVSESPPESPVGLGVFTRPTDTRGRESPLREKKVRNQSNSTMQKSHLAHPLKGKTKPVVTTKAGTAKPRPSKPSSSVVGKPNASTSVPSASALQRKSTATKSELPRVISGAVNVGTSNTAVAVAGPGPAAGRKANEKENSLATGGSLAVPSLKVGLGNGPSGGPRRVPLDSAEAPPIVAGAATSGRRKL